MFMGDDDYFNKGILEKYLHFLRENIDKGYVLRSYLSKNPDTSLLYGFLQNIIVV